MPVTIDIETADPLTAVQATRLKAAIRALPLYWRNRTLYPDVGPIIDAKVDVDDNDSRFLSASVVAIDEIGDTTVAVKGGRQGVDYSALRDREDLLTQCLDLLIDRPAGLIGSGSAGAYSGGSMKNQSSF